MNINYPNNLLDQSPSYYNWKEEIKYIINGSRSDIIERIGRVDTYVKGIIDVSEHPVLSEYHFRTALNDALNESNNFQNLKSDVIIDLCYLALKFDINNINIFYRYLNNLFSQLSINESSHTRTIAHMCLEIIGKHFSNIPYDTESNIDNFRPLLKQFVFQKNKIAGLSIYYYVKLFNYNEEEKATFINLLSESDNTYSSFLNWILHNENEINNFEDIIYSLIRQDESRFINIISNYCQAEYDNHFPPQIIFGDKYFVITSDVKRIKQIVASSSEELINSINQTLYRIQQRA